MPQNARRETFAYLFNIFPTLCELLDLDVPESVDGQSLVGAMHRDEPVRDELYLAYERLHRGLRDRHHKLIEYEIAGHRHTQLFDLETDPHELRDLSADPDCAAVLADMQMRLAQQRDAWGDCGSEWGEIFWREMEY